MCPVKGCLVMFSGAVMEADIAAEVLIRLGHLSSLKPFGTEQSIDFRGGFGGQKFTFRVGVIVFGSGSNGQGSWCSHGKQFMLVKRHRFLAADIVMAFFHKPDRDSTVFVCLKMLRQIFTILAPV